MTKKRVDKKVVSLNQETTHVVDLDTGETVYSEIIVSKRVRPDQFLQVYLEDLSKLLRLSEASYRIILWIGKNMSWQTNEIVLISSIKQRISNECDLSINTVRNTIGKLVEQGILLTSERSVYVLSPELFFKGKIRDRSELKRSLLYKLDSTAPDYILPDEE